MNEKEFHLDTGTYVVQISNFEGPVPGKYSGPPEDCYPDEGPEIEFEPKVEFAADEDTEVTTIDFDDFVKAYAAEYTKGDLRKAQDRIENETIMEIMEAADDCYEPDYEP